MECRRLPGVEPDAPLGNSKTSRSDLPEDDPDILMAARLYVAMHGRQALAQARCRAKELLREGSGDGHALWLAIARAIDRLQGPTR